MKAVLQRVSAARVLVAGEQVGSIEKGLMVFLGVAAGDTERDAEFLAQRTARLRLFPDQHSKFHYSLLDVGGAALVVSQFTLFADTSKGRRPSFFAAAEPSLAEDLIGHYVAALQGLGVHVATGRFGAHMEVEVVNDGPVTIILDSKEAASR